jgi:hypothetical protein
MIDKRKVVFVVIIFLVLVVLGFFILFRFFEDSWIKDSRGVWIMHGNPSNRSLEIQEQQNAIVCAGELYALDSLKNVSFDSQCLGTCKDYSIDVVHVPRIAADDLIENQCADYLAKKTNHFIELNKDGNIVRIL